MACVELRSLRKGDFFTLQPCTDPDSCRVWIRGKFYPGAGYSCYKFDDVNHESFWKGSKKVYVGFTF